MLVYEFDALFRPILHERTHQLFQEELQAELPAHLHIFLDDLQKHTANKDEEGNTQPVVRICDLNYYLKPAPPVCGITIADVSGQASLHEALTTIITGNFHHLENCNYD